MFQYNSKKFFISGKEALLTSCCSSNVMGKQWKDIFIDAMSYEDKFSIRHFKGRKFFKFSRETPINWENRISLLRLWETIYNDCGCHWDIEAETLPLKEAYNAIYLGYHWIHV